MVWVNLKKKKKNMNLLNHFKQPMLRYTDSVTSASYNCYAVSNHSGTLYRSVTIEWKPYIPLGNRQSKLNITTINCLNLCTASSPDIVCKCLHKFRQQTFWQPNQFHFL